MKTRSKILGILLVAVMIVTLLACEQNTEDAIKYINVSEDFGGFSDYMELTDTVIEEIDIENYTFTPSRLDKKGVLSQRWILDKTAETKENDKTNNYFCHPADDYWTVYNTFYREILQVNPMDVSDVKANNDKYLDFAETYLSKEKKGRLVSAPFIDMFGNYLFYHIGLYTCVYDIKEGKQLFTLSNLRQQVTKFCVRDDKLYTTNGISGIHQLSIVDLKNGNVTSIDGKHDYVYRINDSVWVKTRDNNLIKIDFESNSFSNTIFSLDGTESIFYEGAARIFDTDQYGDYILGCNYTPLEHKYDDRWFHEGEHFNRYTISTEKWIPHTIETYFLLNPEHPEDVVYLDEQILGSMDARVKVLGSHFIIENDKVLKCIDPFKQEDIWWINREDVGENAKILWADERGVLVYSQTHQKLYCFE